MSWRRCVVYPVTTTSGNTEMARSMATLMLERPPTVCAVPRYPMRLNTSTASPGAVRVYFPSASVTVLVLDPRTRTVTLRMGVPVS